MNEFEAIYRAYFQYVFFYLKSLSGSDSVAEELTSQTFFRAMKALPAFRGDCNVRGWLCQIAKNSYFSYLRKQKQAANLPDIQGVPASNLESRLADKHSALQIHAIVHTLGEPYKEVFLLRVFGELSFREIGDLFGKNQNWACVTFHRAKRQVQNQWEELCHEERKL